MAREVSSQERVACAASAAERTESGLGRLTTIGTLISAPVAPDANTIQSAEGGEFLHCETPLVWDPRATVRGAGAAEHVSESTSLSAGGWGSENTALALR
jgi:hypothetical protein